MRPVMRYFGGKFTMAPWIISHFPKHRVYTEPFGGSASVLMLKDPCHSEVYNDLDSEVVNVFRVLRDPESGAKLRREIELTPFAREEHNLAYVKCDDPIEQARRTIIKTYFTHGSDALWRKSGFRSNSNRSGTTPARDWKNYPGNLDYFVQRLQGVVIENTSYEKIIERHDTKLTLHYIDPPYVHETRSSDHGYLHEFTDKDHKKLSQILHAVSGMVIISGYPSTLYKDLYRWWSRDEHMTYVSGNKKRTEMLWANFDFNMQRSLFL